MSKKIVLNVEACVGCGACTVACMDQNDMLFDPNDGTTPHRRVFQVEEGHFPDAKIHYASISCMHCQDPACVAGCPTGALKKDKETGAVVYDQNLCIGCHSCALACPFGIPRYNRDNKVIKCGECAGRVKAGLLPACVRVCQTGALQFAEVNEYEDEKETRFLKSLF